MGRIYYKSIDLDWHVHIYGVIEYITSRLI